MAREVPAARLITRPAKAKRLSSMSSSAAGLDDAGPPSADGRSSRHVTEMFSYSFAGKQFHVRVNHDADELVKSHLWFPTENLLRF